MENWIMNRLLVLAISGGVSIATILQAQVPQLINYQGRVVVGTTNFNGAGQFKFALVNANGTQTFWSNDNTSVAGSQPTAAVTNNVPNGLYSGVLGDNTRPDIGGLAPGGFDKFGGW